MITEKYNLELCTMYEWTVQYTIGCLDLMDVETYLAVYAASKICERLNLLERLTNSLARFMSHWFMSLVQFFSTYLLKFA